MGGADGALRTAKSKPDYPFVTSYAEERPKLIEVANPAFA